MTKQILIFLAKAFILYLVFLVLWIDLILIETAIPRLVFERQPFVQSSALVVIFGAAISVLSRSKTPILWAVFWPAFSAGFIAFPNHATPFIAFFLLVAAISFLYRNKVTEPLLVMLPILAGAWLFLSAVYSPYLVAWAYYITGKKALIEAVLAGCSILSDQVYQTALIAPILAMYFLGKQAYAKRYPGILALRFGKLRDSPPAS